jgi:opacity protein-like surface antigen
MRSYVLAMGALLVFTDVGLAQTAWPEAYIGGGFGLTSYDDVLAEETALINGAPALRDEPRAMTGHVFGGFRWSNGPMVWGPEAELQVGTGNFRATVCELETICAASGLLGEVSTTARLRFVAGYPLDERTLLLGSIGVTAARVTVDGIFAAASVETGSGNASTTFSDPVSGLATGYSLGLGLERLLDDRLSIQFGVLYDNLNLDIGKSASSMVWTSNRTDESSAGAALSDDLGFQNLSLRIGMVYRF